MDVKKILLLSLSLASLLFAQELFHLKSPPKQIIGTDESGFMQPRWSPDGTLIAFTSSNYKGLWVADSNGANIRQLTNEPAAGFDFRWSPASDQIATRVARYENFLRFNAVELLEINGPSKKMLTSFSRQLPGTPQWQNDGMLSYFDGQKLASIKVKNNVNKINERTLVFIKKGYIAVYRPDKDKVVLQDPLRKGGYLNVVLSPDQKKIAFELMGGNMYVMDVTGTNVRDLGRGYRPQWSPDSKYIVYMLTEDNGHDYTASDIYVVSVYGNEKQNITSSDDRLEMNPHWSPDGKKIAYDDYRAGSIYIIELESK